MATEAAPESAEDQARDWVARFTARCQPLETAANLAGWAAATTGDEADLLASADARAAVRRLHCDPEAAAKTRAFLNAPNLSDPSLRRELTLLELAFAENQLPPEVIDDLTARESELEQIFYNFRPDFEGRAASNNALLDVLRHETDETRRRAAWEASKKIAGEVAPHRAEPLVRRRNAAARSQGFDNHYAKQLGLEEIDEGELFAMLDEFRASSDAPFTAVRAEIDSLLARKFSTSPERLYPWHWEDFFAQEAPAIGEVNLDPLFAGANFESIATEYFATIGLPIEDVLARSDLYERPSKDQHAFCTDIDRLGDIRVLCNLRQTERWMGTLLHELGHAAYDKYIPGDLPYLCRRAGHTLLTEAVAMYMGRLTRDGVWLRESLGVELDAEITADVRRQLEWSMLVSARWILVMVYFERELYRDPEREDLNELWWDLVESIQMVKRPEGRDEPDWAAKLHLSLAPVYYHNYLLGEFAASQFGAVIRARGGALASRRDPAIGHFLRDELFSLGASRPWNEIMRGATGAPLTSRYFLDDFVTQLNQ